MTMTTQQTIDSTTLNYGALAELTASSKSEQQEVTRKARLREFSDTWPVAELTIGVGDEAEQHGFYLPGVLRDTAERITHASVRLSEGDTFTKAELQWFADQAANYLQSSQVAFEAANTLAGGKERTEFDPFCAWAENLCTDKNGIIRLQCGDDVNVNVRSEGVLKASMNAVLQQLISGRKWEGFTAKMARKAFSAELAGESEEISAVGTLNVIGQDKGKAMATLAEKMHEAVDALLAGTKPLDAAKAIFSQVRFTGIHTAHFVVLVQAALYGRYAFACKRLSDVALKVAKDGAQAEAQEAKTQAQATRRAVSKDGKDRGVPQAVQDAIALKDVPMPAPKANGKTSKQATQTTTQPTASAA